MSAGKPIPNIDIRPDHWQIVQRILQQHVPQYAVWAFGSRAKWTAKEYSDLDLAIITDTPLPLDVSASLRDDFSESNLPWKVDVVDWATTSASFRKIIERDKVVVQEVERSLGMGGEWRPVSLGKIFKVKHGFAFKGEYFTDEPQDTVLVTPGNFAIGGGFQDGKRKYYNGPVPEDYVLKPGQVVVTMTDLSKESDTLGYAASVPSDSTIWLHNQRVGLLEFNSAIPTSPRFVQYLLRTHEYRSWIVGSATGTTVKHTSPGRIESFATRVPPIQEQHAIAHILGTLDDKIELNRKQNETLEAMSRALFKAWFVDFEPVRAKLEGRWQRDQSLPGLPAHLYDLFPDRLVDSELGEIPQGWRHSTIGAEVTVCGGSTPSTKDTEFWEGGQHHWATPKDLSALKFPVLLDTDRKITAAGLAKISSGLLPVGTILLSSRAPIGYLAIAEVPTAINQGFIAMKCDGVLPNVFVLAWCRESMDAIVGNANGSTFQEISKSNFRPIPVVVPSEPVLEDYRKAADSLYQKIAENERESRSLAQLRDTLLPKLISGRLKLPQTTLSQPSDCAFLGD